MAAKKTQGTGKQRGPGRRFPPGKSGNPRGRSKGALNKVTVEVRELAQRLLHDVRYRAGLEERLHSGKVAPAVECMLWHYAYGKPKETVQIQNPDGSAIVIREVLGASE